MKYYLIILTISYLGILNFSIVETIVNAPKNFPTRQCVINPFLPVGVHYFQSVVNSSSKPTISLIGDVVDVLNGDVTSQFQNTWWLAASTGVVGIGAGTLEGLEATGEAVYVNGISAVRSTNNASQDYFKTTFSPNFRTPFSVFARHDVPPDGKLLTNLRFDDTNITLTNLHEYLYSSIENKPFCYYGLMNFNQLEGIAVSKAPVYGESLLGDARDSYYTQPNFQLPNTFGMVVGCGANFRDISNSELSRILGKILYDDPDGDSSQLNTHSHAISLSACLETVDAINKDMINEVYHLLPNSTINVADLNVFVVDQPTKIVELGKINKHSNSHGGSGWRYKYPPKTFQYRKMHLSPPQSQFPTSDRRYWMRWRTGDYHTRYT